MPAAVEGALAASRGRSARTSATPSPAPSSAWGTAQEAVLKLREAAHVAAEAHHTEQLLHGHLAAIDESVRCFVLVRRRAGARALRGRGDRARGARGRRHELVRRGHPVVDIVPFQRFAVDLADARGVDADLIRWDDARWKKARDAYP